MKAIRVAFCTIMPAILLVGIAVAADKKGAQLGFAGTWTGYDQFGAQVAKIVINEDTFPCRGEVYVQYGRGQMFAMNVNWTREDGKVVGTMAEGRKVKVAEVKLADNKLSGKVTSLASLGGVVDLTFSGFVKKTAE
jgi:hypothetical protein